VPGYPLQFSRHFSLGEISKNNNNKNPKKTNWVPQKEVVTDKIVN
jgi:hypothetical protein